MPRMEPSTPTWLEAVNIVMNDYIYLYIYETFIIINFIELHFKRVPSYDIFLDFLLSSGSFWLKLKSKGYIGYAFQLFLFIGQL